MSAAAATVWADTQLDWYRDARSWPLYEYSLLVEAGGLRWHLQDLGNGPAVLLIHGAGSSAHSWHRLAPLLSARWRVIAMDLPGHGFTRGEPDTGTSLPGISRALRQLLHELAIRPMLLIGHSAGAAIAACMTLDEPAHTRAVISINGSLVPFDRRYDYLFSPLAKLLAYLPLTPELISWGARNLTAVQRLVASTGSRLDQQDIDLYWRLMRSRGHVGGVLKMMANWNLPGLAARLPALTVPLIQIVGTNDRIIPPRAAQQVCELLPGASVVSLQNLGHLAHEERPDTVAAALFAAVDALHDGI